MNYRIVIEKAAEKFIVKLPRPDKERVLKAISRLPEQGDIKQLKGQKSRGMFRLRVGDYRIIYTVDDGQLVVCMVRRTHRREM